MARLRPTQYSFGTGEISPRLVGRQDKERYYNALERMENYQITHHGAAERRPGTHFIQEAKFSDRITRLIPFQFSTQQGYVIEAGHLYFRFFKDGGPILVESGPNLLMNAGFDTDLANWTDDSYNGGSSSWEAGSAKLTGVGLSTDLIINGAFNTDLSGWIPFELGDADVKWEDGQAKLFNSGQFGAQSAISQDLIIRPRVLHQLNFVASGKVIVQLRDSVTGVQYYINEFLSGQHSLNFVLNNSNIKLSFFSVNEGTFTEVAIDNVNLLATGDGAIFQDITGLTVGVSYQIQFQVLEGRVAMELSSLPTGERITGAISDSNSGLALVNFTAPSNDVRVYLRSDSAVNGPVSRIDFMNLHLANVPIEVVTPYISGDLEDLTWVQSADTLYLFHPRYAPMKLVRSSHTDWTLSQIVFSSPATEEGELDPGVEITLSAVTGSGITITAGVNLFLNADVGRVIRGPGISRAVITAFGTQQSVTADVLNDFPSTTVAAGTWALLGSPNAQLTPGAAAPPQRVITLALSASGWRTEDIGKYVFVNGGIVRIKSLQDAGTANGTILRSLDDADAAVSGSWTLESEAWSDANGFPKTATFHEGRLYAAATSKRPQTVWASVIDSYEDFGRGTKEDEGLEFTVASPLVDAIEWLLPNNELFIGTFGGVHKVTGSQDKHITPADISVRNQSAYGSSKHKPVRVGSSIIYIARGKNRVYELAYNLDADAFISQDLTILSDHLGEDFTFEELSYAQSPWNTVYVRRSDGILCGLAYNRVQNQVGWYRVLPAAAGVVESLATIPHWTEPYDATHVIVSVTANGASKKYIAFFDRKLNTDLALVREPKGSVVTVVSGLGHLEGLSVDVIGDGAKLLTQVVAGGSVNLSHAADSVEVGLHYKSILTTLPLANAESSLAGLKKRVSEVLVRFYRTLSAVVNGNIVPLRKPEDPMGQQIPEFTGESKVVNIQVDDEGKVTIEQRDPLPQTILYVTTRVDVNTL